MQPDFTKRTIKDHLQKCLPLREYREVVFQLLESLYIDDSWNNFKWYQTVFKVLLKIQKMFS